MPTHAQHPRLMPAAADRGAADVRALLRAARQAVLAGVCVLFSRVVPLDCKDPSVHPLWQLALKVHPMAAGLSLSCMGNVMPMETAAMAHRGRLGLPCAPPTDSGSAATHFRSWARGA